jgi:hypothetical protein
MSQLAVQIGGYARPPYWKRCHVQDQSPKPLDVTDWVWAAEAEATSMGHIINARSLARTYLHVNHLRMLSLRGLSRDRWGRLQAGRRVSGYR